MTMEFIAWPKTPRLFRDIVVTEKLDGTNSAIIIQEHVPFEDAEQRIAIVEDGDKTYAIGAQSRNRLIFPGKTTDNYGFAAWVQENAEQLFDLLGPGRHYGEWWGQGIARKYSVTYRVFSLFNTEKHQGLFEAVGDHSIETVPVLYQGEFDQNEILNALYDLKESGSVASPGFRDPEGIVVFHTQSRKTYKVTLDNQDKGKWEALDA